MLYRFQTTTIKEKKKAYLDTENGTAVVGKPTAKAGEMTEAGEEGLGAGASAA